MDNLQIDYWLCTDCMLLAVTGDEDGIDDEARAAEVRDALASMPAGLVPIAGEDNEFSWRRCDCCMSRLGGSRHPFTVIGAAA